MATAAPAKEQLVGVPKDQLEALVAQAQAYQQLAAQQKAAPAKDGGLEKTVAKEAPKPKEPFSWDKLEENYIYRPARAIDGFVGSTLRTAATTQNVLFAAPLFAFNPLLGLAYAGIMGATAYVSTNVLHKLARLVPKYTYQGIIHPIKTLGGVLGGAAKFTGAGWFTRIIDFVKEKTVGKPASAGDNKPHGIRGFFFGAENKSKLGRLVGLGIGGGAALKVLSPDLYSELAGKLADYFVPKAVAVKDGVVTAGEKIAGLADSVFYAGKDYYFNNVKYAF